MVNDKQDKTTTDDGTLPAEVNENEVQSSINTKIQKKPWWVDRKKKSWRLLLTLQQNKLVNNSLLIIPVVSALLSCLG